MPEIEVVVGDFRKTIRSDDVSDDRLIFVRRRTSGQLLGVIIKEDGKWSIRPLPLHDIPICYTSRDACIKKYQSDGYIVLVDSRF